MKYCSNNENASDIDFPVEFHLISIAKKTITIQKLQIKNNCIFIVYKLLCSPTKPISFQQTKLQLFQQ